MLTPVRFRCQSASPLRMAPGWILAGLSFLTVLNLGCNQTATEPTSPQNTFECALIDAAEPSLDLGVELQVSVARCPWGTTMRADAKNATAAPLLFDRSCAGNDNPRIRIEDPGTGTVYDPFDCTPRPLCPDMPGHEDLAPGLAVPSLVPFTFCTPEVPSGVYTIVATFTFYDEDGVTRHAAEQRLDVYWDSEASAVKAIP